MHKSESMHRLWCRSCGKKRTMFELQTAPCESGAWAKLVTSHSRMCRILQCYQSFIIAAWNLIKAMVLDSLPQFLHVILCLYERHCDPIHTCPAGKLDVLLVLEHKSGRNLTSIKQWNTTHRWGSRCDLHQSSRQHLYTSATSSQIHTNDQSAS